MRRRSGAAHAGRDTSPCPPRSVTPAATWAGHPSPRRTMVERPSSRRGYFWGRQGPARPWGTGEPPLTKGVHHHGADRNRALAGLRLGTADRAVAVGALAHVQLAELEVDVRPREATQLGRAQAREDRGQQHWPPTPVQSGEDRLYFIRAWGYRRPPSACHSDACRRAGLCRAGDGSAGCGRRSASGAIRQTAFS